MNEVNFKFVLIPCQKAHRSEVESKCETCISAYLTRYDMCYHYLQSRNFTMKTIRTCFVKRLLYLLLLNEQKLYIYIYICIMCP